MRPRLTLIPGSSAPAPALVRAVRALASTLGLRRRLRVVRRPAALPGALRLLA